MKGCLYVGTLNSLGYSYVPWSRFYCVLSLIMVIDRQWSPEQDTLGHVMWSCDHQPSFTQYSIIMARHGTWLLMLKLNPPHILYMYMSIWWHYIVRHTFRGHLNTIQKVSLHHRFPNMGNYIGHLFEKLYRGCPLMRLYLQYRFCCTWNTLSESCILTWIGRGPIWNTFIVVGHFREWITFRRQPMHLHVPYFVSLFDMNRHLATCRKELICSFN